MKRREIYLPDAVDDWLERRAEQEQVSIPEVVRRALLALGCPGVEVKRGRPPKPKPAEPSDLPPS